MGRPRLQATSASRPRILLPAVTGNNYIGHNYIGHNVLAVTGRGSSSSDISEPVLPPEPTYIVMAYIVMAYIVMAYRARAYTVMAYIVKAFKRHQRARPAARADLPVLKIRVAVRRERQACDRRAGSVRCLRRGWAVRRAATASGTVR